MEFEVRDLLLKLSLLSYIKSSKLLDGGVHLKVSSRNRLLGTIVSSSGDSFAKVDLGRVTPEELEKDILIDSNKLISLLSAIQDPDAKITLSYENRYLKMGGALNGKISIYGARVQYPTVPEIEEGDRLKTIDNPFTKDDLMAVKIYNNFTSIEKVSFYKTPTICKKLKVTDSYSIREHKKPFDFPYRICLIPSMYGILGSVIKNKLPYSLLFTKKFYVLEVKDLKFGLYVARDVKLEESWVQVDEENLEKYKKDLTSKLIIKKEDLLKINTTYESLIGKDNKVTLDFENKKATLFNMDDVISVDFNFKVEGESISKPKTINFRKFYGFSESFQKDEIEVLTSPDPNAILVFDNECETSILTSIPN